MSRKVAKTGMGIMGEDRAEVLRRPPDVHVPPVLKLMIATRAGDLDYTVDAAIEEDGEICYCFLRVTAVQTSGSQRRNVTTMTFPYAAPDPGACEPLVALIDSLIEAYEGRSPDPDPRGALACGLDRLLGLELVGHRKNLRLPGQDRIHYDAFIYRERGADFLRLRQVREADGTVVWLLLPWSTAVSLRQQLLRPRRAACRPAAAAAVDRS